MRRLAHQGPALTRDNNNGRVDYRRGYMCVTWRGSKLVLMATNDGGTAGGAPAAQQQTWGQMLKGLLFQMLIIYFITSFFRGGNKQPQTEDGKPAVAARNLFPNNEKMVF